MGNIHYKIGDATAPEGDGMKIIAHIVNNAGYWGKGFVMAISKKWPAVREHYLEWYDQGEPQFKLGAIQVLDVAENIQIANIVGQHGIRFRHSGVPPIRYEALEVGLRLLAFKAREKEASVHMPRIGTGLAGGDWKLIEPIILDTLISSNVSVTVYDLP